MGYPLAYGKVIQGISTKYGEAILSNLKPGMVYSMKKEKGLPYRVMNKTDKKVELEIVIEKPLGRHLMEGYEPVPDVSWITMHPARFILGPGEEAVSDIIISIPNDKKYENRHFQASLIVRSVSDPNAKGVSISLSLQNRLRFSTGPTPEQVYDDYRKRIKEALKIDMEPFGLFVSDVESGKKVTLGEGSYSTLQLVNRGKEECAIEFEVADDPKLYGLVKDYDPLPEAIKVEFPKKRIKLKQRVIEDIPIRLNIPDGPEYRDKNYGFVVRAKITSLDIPIEIFSRVYIKTKK
jgi:hypothetical protein